MLPKESADRMMLEKDERKESPYDPSRLILTHLGASNAGFILHLSSMSCDVKALKFHVLELPYNTYPVIHPLH